MDYSNEGHPENVQAWTQSQYVPAPKKMEKIALFRFKEKYL
jgi:hypothetical protein